MCTCFFTHSLSVFFVIYRLNVRLPTKAQLQARRSPLPSTSSSKLSNSIGCRSNLSALIATVNIKNSINKFICIFRVCVCSLNTFNRRHDSTSVIIAICESISCLKSIIHVNTVTATTDTCYERKSHHSIGRWDTIHHRSSLIYRTS